MKNFSAPGAKHCAPQGSDQCIRERAVQRWRKAEVPGQPHRSTERRNCSCSEGDALLRREVLRLDPLIRNPKVLNLNMGSTIIYVSKHLHSIPYVAGKLSAAREYTLKIPLLTAGECFALAWCWYNPYCWIGTPRWTAVVIFKTWTSEISLTCYCGSVALEIADNLLMTVHKDL